MEFIVKQSSEEDRPRIMDYLRKHFYSSEPISKSLGLYKEEGGFCSDFDSYIGENFDITLSLVAEAEGQIVGLCLNSLLLKGVPPKEANYTCKEFMKLFKALEHVESKGDVFIKYPTIEKGLVVFVLSVHENYRRRGIAKEFVIKTKEIAENNGAEVISVTCSSHFSATLFKSFGFEVVYSIKYADFKLDGKVTIQPEEPHTVLNNLAFRL